MLSLVATPIGNLDDLTYRGLKTLQIADYILAEDTRHSLKLLRHFKIEKPLFSFHSYNEKEKIESILQDLKAGRHVALICDAGTPGICDPSAFLVQACHRENIKVIAAVGASSVISALSLYGHTNGSFQFLGFAPKESKTAEPFLKQALSYPGLSIFFDTPHQIKKTLTLLTQLDPTRQVTLIKEISKIHESINTQTAIDWLQNKTDFLEKGEFVALVEGKAVDPHQVEEDRLFSLLDEETDLSFNEKIRLASKILNTSKNALYKRKK